MPAPLCAFTFREKERKKEVGLRGRTVSLFSLTAVVTEDRSHSPFSLSLSLPFPLSPQHPPPP